MKLQKQLEIKKKEFVEFKQRTHINNIDELRDFGTNFQKKMDDLNAEIE